MCLLELNTCSSFFLYINVRFQELLLKVTIVRRQELMAERAKQKETELDKIKRTMMETGMVLFMFTYFPLASC